MTNHTTRTLSALALFVLAAIAMSIGGCGSQPPSGPPVSELYFVFPPHEEMAVMGNLRSAEGRISEQHGETLTGAPLTIRTTEVGRSTITLTKHGQQSWVAQGSWRKYKRTQQGIDVWVFEASDDESNVWGQRTKEVQKYLDQEELRRHIGLAPAG